MKLIFVFLILSFKLIAQVNTQESENEPALLSEGTDIVSDREKVLISFGAQMYLQSKIAEHTMDAHERLKRIKNRELIKLEVEKMYAQELKAINDQEISLKRLRDDLPTSRGHMLEKSRDMARKNVEEFIDSEYIKHAKKNLTYFTEADIRYNELGRLEVPYTSSQYESFLEGLKETRTYQLLVKEEFVSNNLFLSTPEGLERQLEIETDKRYKDFSRIDPSLSHEDILKKLKEDQRIISLKTKRDNILAADPNNHAYKEFKKIDEDTMQRYQKHIGLMESHEARFNAEKKNLIAQIDNSTDEALRLVQRRSSAKIVDEKAAQKIIDLANKRNGGKRTFLVRRAGGIFLGVVLLSGNVAYIAYELLEEKLDRDVHKASTKVSDLTSTKKIFTPEITPEEFEEALGTKILVD